jgi:hypothetical protein
MAQRYDMKPPLQRYVRIKREGISKEVVKDNLELSQD